MPTVNHLIASLVLVYSLVPSLYAATSPVGSTAGQFEVNSNGAATYTVPIHVPTGINGIEPKLALVYNSQQGNGLLGLGWSLSGLSTVSRCPATIAVDGVRSGINFSGSQFCWNGQRLIAKSSGGSQETGTDASGAFWEFRTEIESFARVRAYGSLTSPAFFKIWTQDGRLLSFGATADANVNPQGKGTLIWALDREQDRKGNYLSVSYGSATDDSEYYPLSMQYGGVSGTATRSVVFGMDASARADASTKYVSGAKIVSTKRLKSITAKFGSNTVRSYTLAYTGDATTASRSLLQSVQECGSDGICYNNKLSFTASNAGSNTFTAAPTAVLTSGTEMSQWNQLADVNGDGLTDVFKVTDAATGRVVVNLGLPGGGFGGDVPTTGVITNETTAGSGFNQWNELADMNGDGIMDIFRVMPPTSGTVADARVYLGNTDGSGKFSTTPILLSSAVTYGAQGFRFWNQLIDMNGDGLADIFRVLPNTRKFTVNYGYIQSGNYKLLICLDSDATCWTDGLAISNGSHGFRQTNQLADMNSDGIIDIFRVFTPSHGSDPASATNVNIFFGKTIAHAVVAGGTLIYASLTVDQPNLVTPMPFSNSTYGGYFNFYNQLLDVNADGITDLVRLTGTNESHTGTFLSQTYSGCNRNVPPGFCQYDEYHEMQIRSANTINVRLGLGDGTFEQTELQTPNVLTTDSLVTKSLLITVNARVDKSASKCTQIGTTFVSYKEPLPAGTHLFGTYGTNDQIYVWDCKNYNAFSNGVKGITHSNQFIDIDGDGYVDIISADGIGALRVAYGKGNGYFNSPVSLNQSVNISKGFRAYNQFADMNGDGIVDLFKMSGTTGTPTISGRKQAGLLTSVIDGNNLATSITYQPLSNSTAYTKSAGVDAYPLRKMGMPQYVVTASTAAAPGFSYSYSYKYSDARVDLTRGWLGFASMTRTDSGAALETSTHFNQAFPYSGRPSEQTVRNTSAAAAKFLSKTTYSWADRVDTGVNAAGKVHFVHQTGSVQTNYEPNTSYSTALTTTTSYLNNAVTGNYDATPYDQYGNPEKVQVAYSDGHTLTSVYDSSYVSTSASLYLGQVSQRDTTITHATPAPTSETRTRVSRDTFFTDGLPQTTVTQPDAGHTNTELKLTTSYTYDANGRVLTHTAEGADPSYDAGGSVASNPSVTRQISYAYGAEDAVANSLTVTKTTSVTAASSHSETLKYDLRYGAQTARTDAAGINTAWGYDGFGRKITEVNYSGSTRPVTTTISLSALGAAACPALTGLSYCATTSHSGVSTTLSAVTAQYDALGRELRVISKDALAKTVYTDTQYNAAGKLWRVSRPYYSTATPQWMSTSYDLAQRPYQTTQANGATSTINYQGLSSTVTLAAGGDTTRTTTTVKNSQGDTTKVIDAMGYTTSYGYGAFGLLKTVTDAKGNIISNAYDIFGNKTTLTDPDLGTWQFRYNAFGDLKWQKDAKNQITSLSYDLRGRSISRTEHGGVATSWVYDTAASGQGRLDSSTRGGITQSYSYDPVTGQTRSAGVNISGVSYSAITDYDDLGRVQFITYPAAALKVKYGYHPNGALLDITDASSAALYWKATDYNADGLPVAEAWGNGITGTRGYNPATGAVTSIVSGAVQNLGYSYYGLGNLQSRSNNLTGIQVTETFYYDTLNRLKRVSASNGGIKNFDYDAIGNLSFKSGVGNYSYGARPHAVTQVTPTSADLSGDADGNGIVNSNDSVSLREHILGNLTASGKPDCNQDSAVNILDVLCLNNRLLNQTTSGSVSHTYAYDNNGNMESGGGRNISYTAFNMPATVDNNGQRETYGYAPDYSRLSKEIKTISTGAVSEKITYLGKLYERIERGGVIEERFYISTGDRLVAQLNKTGAGATVHYIHSDRLGSVETVTNAAKTAVDKLSFDAFGLARKDTWQDGTPSAAFTKTTRGYTGHETDITTGLVNMNARLYEPWLGRFLQADTLIPDVFQPQSINPYSYVMNNPFGYTDPSGHVAIPFENGVVFEDQLNMYFFPEGMMPGVQSMSAGTGQAFSSAKLGLDTLFPGFTATNCVGQECGGFQALVFEYNYYQPPDNKISQPSDVAGKFLCQRMGCDPFSDIPVIFAPSAVGQAISKASPKLADGVVRIAGDAWQGLKGLFSSRKGGFANEWVKFGQPNVKSTFAHGPFQGKTIGDVAKKLRSDDIHPDQLPIEFIVRNGERVTLNNRSLTALRRAGMQPTKLIDRTGSARHERLLDSHLKETSPSNVIRIRGAGPNASLIE